MSTTNLIGVILSVAVLLLILVTGIRSEREKRAARRRLNEYGLSLKKEEKP